MTVCCLPFVLCCIDFVVSSCMFELPPPTPASLSVSASGLLALCPPAVPPSGCICCVLSPWLICVGSVCKSAFSVLGNVGWHFGLLTMFLDCNPDFFSHHQPRAGLLLVSLHACCPVLLFSLSCFVDCKSVGFSRCACHVCMHGASTHPCPASSVALSLAAGQPAMVQWLCMGAYYFSVLFGCCFLFALLVALRFLVSCNVLCMFSMHALFLVAMCAYFGTCTVPPPHFVLLCGLALWHAGTLPCCPAFA